MTSMTALILPLSEEGGDLSKMFEVGVSSYVWTILIFLVALPFMWKVVFGPITKALDEREGRSREAARAAEAAREEVQQMQSAIQEEMEQARREAAQSIAEARARAENREKEILAAAQAQAERDRQRAQEEIDRSLASAREQLRTDAVVLGVDIAEKVLQREFGEADQARLVSTFQKEVAEQR